MLIKRTPKGVKQCFEKAPPCRPSEMHSLAVHCGCLPSPVAILCSCICSDLELPSAIQPSPYSFSFALIPTFPSRTAEGFILHKASWLLTFYIVYCISSMENAMALFVIVIMYLLFSSLVRIFLLHLCVWTIVDTQGISIGRMDKVIS